MGSPTTDPLLFQLTPEQLAIPTHARTEGLLELPECRFPRPFSAACGANSFRFLLPVQFAALSLVESKPDLSAVCVLLSRVITSKKIPSPKASLRALGLFRFSPFPRWDFLSKPLKIPRRFTLAEKFVIMQFSSGMFHAPSIAYTCARIDAQAGR
jgi:hypothetical protein